MDEAKLIIENYTDVQELHDKITELIEAYGLTKITAVGLLEMIKISVCNGINEDD